METFATFMARVEPHVRRESFLDIMWAYKMSKDSLRGQERMEVDENGKHVRTFEHSRRVALIVLDELRSLDPVLIICSLLHDLMEDSRDVTEEFIHHCFGWQIAEIVAVVSKVNVAKEDYVPRLATFPDWHAVMVKACDRLDNLRTLYDTPEAFRRKQIKETKEKYMPVFAKMVGDVPGTERERALYLYNEIAAQVCAHTAILDGEN